MRRVALSELELSDGTRIHKGGHLAVATERMRDPAVYSDPERWDGYRFLNMRQNTPGKEYAAQLVSTGADHLGFGHGEHACPGRFFAANEVKIALVHILLMYDFRLPKGVEPRVMVRGFSLAADPKAKLELRRREGGDEILQQL
jgi:cytochrome P450